MLTAVLIDDEKNALEVLELQLARFCQDVTVLEKCNSGEQGIAAIRKHQPDLVFVDIEMPHVNGFDVLKATAGLQYEVIFTTAYDQFAIKAIKFSALDYLLKPVDITELQAAVKKAEEKKGTGSVGDKLNVLLQQLQQPVRKQERIALPIGDAMQFFHADEILRCESESNYTHIFLTNGKKITTAKTLKDVEESLDFHPFYRIHQSHLVNMNHISKVSKADGGYVVMDDGTQVAISRNKKEAFFESFRRV
jgi:two-component system, LytTR family, response regulator